MLQGIESKEIHNYFDLAYPNGISAAYTYDSRGGLTGLVYTDSSSTIIDTFTYTLDNVGNRLTKTDSEYQYAYTYDPVYRLTQSQPTQVAQNPIFQQTVESFSYDAVGNKLTGPAYEKDASYTQSYAYDYDNRLVSVTKQVSGNPNPDVITFKYDPFGRRVEKNVSTYENGLPTTDNYVYVYDNEDIILEILTRTQNGSSITTTTAYTHGPGIDEPLSMTRDGQTYYYHADGLGSITSITDTAESVVNRYAYDSFGAIKASETVRNAYAFTGREYDSETGLYYYRARYYDPEAGRFIGKDPIGFEGGDKNQFGYVANNVINHIDPSGLINPAKTSVAIINMGNAGRLYAAGFLKMSNGSFAWGAWNVSSGYAAQKRAMQQWRESLNECWSDASWKNLWGLAPFGQKFDDPGEPSPIDYFKQELKKQDWLQSGQGWAPPTKTGRK